MPLGGDFKLNIMFCLPVELQKIFKSSRIKPCQIRITGSIAKFLIR